LGKTVKLSKEAAERKGIYNSKKHLSYIMYLDCFVFVSGTVYCCSCKILHFGVTCFASVDDDFVFFTVITHEPLVNLCDFNKEIDTFLIANHHMYIFYKKYVWLVNLKDMTYDKEPKLITDYLYFLPDDFKEVSHIYQRPSGDVLIVVKNLYYLIDFPSFNVKNGYNGQSIENLRIPKGKRIDAIFRTYSGKTYIFYDKVL
jgi:hypothetical protein